MKKVHIVILIVEVSEAESMIFMHVDISLGLNQSVYRLIEVLGLGNYIAAGNNTNFSKTIVEPAVQRYIKHKEQKNTSASEPDS